MKRATITQVARLAGVSIKTVSRVTNNEQNVSAAVRERVTAAVRELNYMPSFSARSLAGRSSYLLGLVYDNPSPSYLQRLQGGVLHACDEAGYRLLFHPCDYRDPQLGPALVSLAQELHLEGLILTPPVSSLAQVTRQLREAQIRIVRIAPGGITGDKDAVAVDDVAAARALTEHLVALGHRRIALILGHPDHAATAQRLAGYRQALQRAHIPLDEALVEPGQFSFESGKVAASVLLSRGRHSPTAVIASNDDMAAGVIAEARDRGLRLPEQLSICGFDDTPLAAKLWPPLTTMRQPLREMAQAATRLLLRQIGATIGNAPVPQLGFELVQRESTAPPPRGRSRT